MNAVPWWALTMCATLDLRAVWKGPYHTGHQGRAGLCHRPEASKPRPMADLHLCVTHGWYGPRTQGRPHPQTQTDGWIRSPGRLGATAAPTRSYRAGGFGRGQAGGPMRLAEWWAAQKGWQLPWRKACTCTG